MNTIERFESKYIPEPNSGCWLWSGSLRGSYDYGQFSLTHTKPVPAHRFSYTTYRGDIPKGMLVLHTCDVPTCVNPDHLFLGTQDDNMRDKVNKGRQAKGEKQGLWKGGISSNMLEYQRAYRKNKRAGVAS